MKTKFNGILTLLLALVVQISFAQDKLVSGTVSDETSSLPGVTVLKKGTTQGTETDFDGKYSIKTKTGDVLVFSFIGMKTTEKIVGSSNTINVLMANDNVLDEIIVTSLGIKRKPRELTYSTASVNSKDLTKTKSLNVTSAVVGKVSGLQINTIGNGVNPNTRITLRGNRSLKGNNEALIVLDGSAVNRNVIDRINPDDIATFTVLKGANAAVLYGSQATNGVVIITTKTGRGKMSVNYSTTLQFENVAYLPEFQDKFGAGGFPDGTLLPLENVNWGPKYDGRLVDVSETLDNGEVWQVPFTPIKNRNENFFNTGTTIRHGVSISGGDEISDFLLSLDQSNVKGIVPKDKYNRTNLRFKANRTYNNLKVGANLSFFRSHSNTVASQAGRQDRPVYWNVINTPLHVPLSEMKNWRTGKFTRNEVSFFRFYENPYYIIDTQRQTDDINQFNINTNVEYKLTDWLTASLNSNYSSSSNTFKRKRDAFTYAFELADTYASLAPFGARVDDRLRNEYSFNNNFLLSFDNKITENFSSKLIVGNNIRIDKSDYIYTSGENLIVPNFYNISTRKGQPVANQATSQERKIGAFADLTLNFKDYLFLTLSGRNEWTSTLSKDNRSFFYPGAGISFIPSDAFPTIKSDNGINYLKTSFNITKTGNNAAPYQINNIFFTPNGTTTAFPYADAVGLSQSSQVANPNLNPEFTTSLEASLEFGLFKNRLTGSFTAYKTNSVDQIIPANISLASGARRSLTNLGEVENQGFEIDLNATVIQNDNFKWEIGGNYTGLKSEVISLADGLNEVNLGSSAGVDAVAIVGQPFPLIKTTSYERDSEGRVVVGANGNPLTASKNETHGQTTPDKIIGLNTTIKYKNFTLYAVADYRTGHVFYNTLVDALEFTGLTQHSATSNRQAFVFPNSSYSDGSGGHIANTNRLTTDGGNNFWDVYGDIKENYVTDASAIKLRQVSLSYQFDKSMVEKLGIDDLSLTFFGRNLLTIRPDSNVYTDPEFNSSNTSIVTGAAAAASLNFTGVGTQAQTPPTRQFGLTLNVKF